jgi:hypothetical protein
MKSTDDRGTHIRKHAAALPHIPVKTGARRRQNQKEHPDGPWRKKNQLPFGKDRCGIFEEKFEHLLMPFLMAHLYWLMGQDGVIDTGEKGREDRETGRRMFLVCRSA